MNAGSAGLALGVSALILAFVPIYPNGIFRTLTSRNLVLNSNTGKYEGTLLVYSEWNRIETQSISIGPKDRVAGSRYYPAEDLSRVVNKVK